MHYIGLKLVKTKAKKPKTKNLKARLEIQQHASGKATLPVK